jgi:predicted ATPase
MNHDSASKKKKGLRNAEGFTQISVCGYKSIARRQSIDVRPLTILAGANSSGKSSIVQPLLVLKQTLEASYDPGTLLLDGPNVRFTSGDQFLSHIVKGKCQDTLDIEMSFGSIQKFRVLYKWHADRGFDIQEMTYGVREREGTLRPDMTQTEIMSSNPILQQWPQLFGKSEKSAWVVTRDRCFLGLELRHAGDKETPNIVGRSEPSSMAVEQLRQLIHVPALRGNPERTYPLTAVGPNFPGTFEKYVASVIAQWQVDDKDTEAMETLNRAIEGLGLTWKVMAEPLTHAQVQLKVGRLPHTKRGGAHDLVTIADVGFGVSQTLPVIVALLVAQSGQAVYLEQPEIHLHPRAQARMGELLSEAARRGVMVIAETHNSLLVRAIQTLVARGDISPDLVKLHWFTRQEDGSTEVNSADLDKDGAFGNRPEDFDETEIAAERDYLDAAEGRTERETVATCTLGESNKR